MTKYLWDSEPIPLSISRFIFIVLYIIGYRFTDPILQLVESRGRKDIPVHRADESKDGRGSRNIYRNSLIAVLLAVEPTAEQRCLPFCKELSPRRERIGKVPGRSLLFWLAASTFGKKLRRVRGLDLLDDFHLDSDRRAVLRPGHGGYNFLKLPLRTLSDLLIYQLLYLPCSYLAIIWYRFSWSFGFCEFYECGLRYRYSAV